MIDDRTLSDRKIRKHLIVIEIVLETLLPRAEQLELPTYGAPIRGYQN